MRNLILTEVSKSPKPTRMTRGRTISTWWQGQHFFYADLYNEQGYPRVLMSSDPECKSGSLSMRETQSCKLLLSSTFDFCTGRSGHVCPPVPTAASVYTSSTEDSFSFFLLHGLGAAAQNLSDMADHSFRAWEGNQVELLGKFYKC